MNTCWKHLSLVCDSLCFPMKFKVGYAVACWLVQVIILCYGKNDFTLIMPL